MSYILDALRKSEQARQLAARNETNTLVPIEIQKERTTWPVPALLAIIALSLLVLIWRAWPTAVLSKERNADTPASPAPPSGSSIQDTRQNLASPPKRPPTVASPRGHLPPAPSGTAEMRQTKNRADRNNPPGTGNTANADLLKDIPPMEITGYIHNGQGDSLAMINNRLVREGEEVSPGLRLEKIKENSAIFSYKGYVFSK